jgi:hypothetical protein
VLTRLLDRSALYGVLAEIDALGLDLLEVRLLEPGRESLDPGDGRAAGDASLALSRQMTEWWLAARGS